MSPKTDLDHSRHLLSQLGFEHIPPDAFLEIRHTIWLAIGHGLLESFAAVHRH